MTTTIDPRTSIQVSGELAPRGPQPGVSTPERRLPLRRFLQGPRLWIVGAHGGSGETTLASLHEAWWPAGHCWPQGPTGTSGCVLTARTSADGLLAAQSALAQWAASGAGTARLLGLVLIADAPGKLPRPLRELACVVAGGAPRLWMMPWIEAWRLGAQPTPDCVRGLSLLVDELNAVAASVVPTHQLTTKENNHGS